MGDEEMKKEKVVILKVEWKESNGIIYPENNDTLRFDLLKLIGKPPMRMELSWHERKK